MMDADSEMMFAVDQLLISTEPPPAQKQMDTGPYDTTVFGREDAVLVNPLERLKDARMGLNLFLEEATRALEVPSDELTPDQRIHVATIVSFIEALGTRLDKVSAPGFVHSRRR